MPERARSFGAVAAAYARYRPGYPAAALDWALQVEAATFELAVLAPSAHETPRSWRDP